MNAKKRASFTIFGVPVVDFRNGHFSAKYFPRLGEILKEYKTDAVGLMQVFCKNDNAVLGGIDEALAVLRLCTGYWKNKTKATAIFEETIDLKGQARAAMAESNWQYAKALNASLMDRYALLDELWVSTYKELDVKALYDGDKIEAFKAVMTIEGVGHHFAHLESVYLGILARGTKIATNTSRVVKAANGKSVLFFADRFDRWSNQTADGYAAMKSGALGVATDSMGKWWGVDGLGTNPHALIAFFEGDTAEATLAFARKYPDADAIALVDYHNDCVKTSLEVARAFRAEGLKLWGVRLDTSGNLSDKSIKPVFGETKFTGVCPQLVWNVRKALDAEGFYDVKIVVSGGFNAEKIAKFEELGVPVDAYGVGSSILMGNFDFTADIVKLNGIPQAKVGRKHNPDSRIYSLDWTEIEPVLSAACN